MTGQIITPTQISQPRIVSLRDLREKLLPLVAGWSWADDALNDLWLLGAPVPEASMCPQVANGTGPACPLRECPHIKRILMPNQFAAWWAEVSARQGWAATPAQVAQSLNQKGRGQ